jgi:hypothetical protein
MFFRSCITTYSVCKYTDRALIDPFRGLVGCSKDYSRISFKISDTFNMPFICTLILRIYRNKTLLLQVRNFAFPLVRHVIRLSLILLMSLGQASSCDSWAKKTFGALHHWWRPANQKSFSTIASLLWNKTNGEKRETERRASATPYGGSDKLHYLILAEKRR